jgi:hypothetical protein
MRTYRITIIMPSGQFCIFNGEYEDGFAACIEYIDGFPQAKSITARRLP